MHRTVEAIVDADGHVRLLEPAGVTVPSPAHDVMFGERGGV